jgi:hypothetical protein
MNWELDNILEQSITQMAEGKAREESCLLAYPAHADELAPLLVVCEELLAFPKPALSAEAKARIEGQLFEAAVASGLVRRERKPLALPRIVLPRWRPAYSAVAALLIVVLLLTTTFVGAANALPGSPLYAVKLATEEARLWVAPARDEPALHLRFAQRRLEEYQELAERGLHDETVLEAMVAHVDAALDGIEELPPAIAGALLDEVADVVGAQQQVLSGMLADLPAASRPAVEQILGRGVAQVARMETMRWAIDRYDRETLPEGGLTTIPTETGEASQTAIATLTPTSSPVSGETEEAPTPTSTSTSGGTEPGEPTRVVPTETPVPTATSVPSATPTPPEISPSPTPTPGTTGEPTPRPTPGTTVEPTLTERTPPGLTMTPSPPGIITRTPEP